MESVIFLLAVLVVAGVTAGFVVSARRRRGVELEPPPGPPRAAPTKEAPVAPEAPPEVALQRRRQARDATTVELMTHGAVRRK